MIITLRALLLDREMAKGGMEGMYRGMAAEMTRAMLFQALLMATKEQFESGVARALGVQ